MNHTGTCLCLLGRSWFSFTDDGAKEGWVGLGSTTVSEQSAQDRYLTAITVVSCSTALLGNWSAREHRFHDLRSLNLMILMIIMMMRMMIVIADTDTVGAGDVGLVRWTSTWYTSLWIHRRTLSAADTRSLQHATLVLFLLQVVLKS